VNRLGNSQISRVLIHPPNDFPTSVADMPDASKVKGAGTRNFRAGGPAANMEQRIRSAWPN
jgi:hypothetical protein